MDINSGEDFLALLNRLLEGLHQAGMTNFGSHLSIVYVASGAQHVDTVQNQYLQTPLPDPPRRRGNDTTEKDANPPFNADTPLSALFRESQHEELRQIIESWRPFLIEADTEGDALQLCTFHFDLARIRPATVYLDFAHLINHEALQSPMSVLAAYMFQHSNLSKSENALYVQLKRYKKLCE